MNEQTRALIKAATVRFTRRGGQGVLVPGRMIVTAAHCVQWSMDGGMSGSLGIDRQYVEEVTDVATEIVLTWLSAEDPHGIHTGHVVRNLRAIMAPDVRVPESDYTIEERIITKLTIT